MDFQGGVVVINWGAARLDINWTLQFFETYHVIKGNCWRGVTMF